MISLVTIAMAAAFLSSPTATIQGTPVCLPYTAQPGHSYQLDVYGQGTFSVTPAPPGSLERELRQVPPSWVTFDANHLTSPATIPLTLTVPGDALPGAYWSDINAADPPTGSGEVRTATAATAGLIFTVGPTKIPAPPCAMISEAYMSTGKMPPWPSEQFATSSMQQLLARGAHAGPTPILSPTAGGQSTVKPHSESVSPSPAANSKSSGESTLWILGVGGIFFLLACLILRRRR